MARTNMNSVTIAGNKRGDFIATGQLAWPFKYQQRLSETGVIEALLNAPDRINNALEFSDNSETLCLRLAMQLPEQSLAQLLPLLSSKSRLAVMIALLETGGIHHDSSLKNQLSHHWNHYVDNAISNRNLAAFATALASTLGAIRIEYSFLR
ncbi:hypothetical protein P4S64_13565 [Vibrio sp. M60_M31a]